MSILVVQYPFGEIMKSVNKGYLGTVPNILETRWTCIKGIEAEKLLHNNYLQLLSLCKVKIL